MNNAVTIHGKRGEYTGFSNQTGMHHFSMYDGSVIRLERLEDAIFDAPGPAIKTNTNTGSPQYTEWEGEIYDLLEEQADVSRSDAQGLALPFESKFTLWYEAMKTPQDIVDIILRDSQVN